MSGWPQSNFHWWCNFKMLAYRREKTLFVSSFTPCSHAKFLSSIRRTNLSICRKTTSKECGYVLRMGADNLKFWKDFWAGGFPGGEAYLTEVIESNFQKPVPGLDTSGVTGQGEEKKAVGNRTQQPAKASSGKDSNPPPSNNGTANLSGGGQVRLVTDPVTGRSRLEVVPEE